MIGLKYPNLSFYANSLIDKILTPPDLTQPENQKLSGSIYREIEGFVTKYSFRYDSPFDCLDPQESKSLEKLRKAFSKFSQTGDLESPITDGFISLPGSKKRPEGLTVRSVFEETQSSGYRDEVYGIKKSLKSSATASFLPPIKASSEKLKYCDYKEQASDVAKKILETDRKLRQLALDRIQFLRDELMDAVDDPRSLPSEAF